MGAQRAPEHKEAGVCRERKKKVGARGQRRGGRSREVGSEIPKHEAKLTHNRTLEITTQTCPIKQPRAKLREQKYRSEDAKESELGTGEYAHTHTRTHAHMHARTHAHTHARCKMACDFPGVRWASPQDHLSFTFEEQRRLFRVGLML